MKSQSGRNSVHCLQLYAVKSPQLMLMFSASGKFFFFERKMLIYTFTADMHTSYFKQQAQEKAYGW